MRSLLIPLTVSAVLVKVKLRKLKFIRHQASSLLFIWTTKGVLDLDAQGVQSLQSVRQEPLMLSITTYM